MIRMWWLFRKSENFYNKEKRFQNAKETTLNLATYRTMNFKTLTITSFPQWSRWSALLFNNSTGTMNLQQYDVLQVLHIISSTIIFVWFYQWTFSSIYILSVFILKCYYGFLCFNYVDDCKNGITKHADKIIILKFINYSFTSWFLAD